MRQNCLIYTRVSTEEQARGGLSLDAQESLCRKYADEHDFVVSGVFREEGKSATTIDRPALQDMLLRCREDKGINALIIQETDRLARNTKDHLTIRSILQKANVKLISVNQPMLDDSPEGNFVDTVLAGVNQFYSQLSGRKVSKVLQDKFENGGWPAGAPLGYINVSDGSNMGGKRSRKIVKEDPERWYLVKQAFKMYLSGTYSADEINDILYGKGLRARGGGKIQRSIMIDTLKNPFHAGLMRWKGQIRKGSHKSMISPREHEQIISIMANHNQHASRRRIHNFLLRGFIFCGMCDGRYVGECHPKKKKNFYRCVAKNHSNQNQFVGLETLEEQVADLFKYFQFSQDKIEKIIEKLKNKHRQQKIEMESEKRTFYARKTAIEQKRNKAEEKLLDGVISDEDFVRIRDKYRLDLDNIQTQITELENRKEVDFDTIRKAAELARNIHQTYQKSSPELKRLYLGLFWEKIIVKDKRIIRAIPTKLFQSIIKSEGITISSNGRLEPLPDSSYSNYTNLLQDLEYIRSLREQLAMIHSMVA